MEVTAVLELLPELDGAIIVLGNGAFLVLFCLRNRLYSEDGIYLFIIILESQKMS